MATPLFSVICPTLGRDTLGRTLASIDRRCSEILVVADTYEMSPLLRRGIASVSRAMGAQYLELDAGRHDTGSPQIAHGVSRARGRWLLVPGDDDVYEPDAFAVMRAAIEAQEAPCPLMFKVALHPAPQRGDQDGIVVLWERPEIVRGRVTGQSFVCPNDPARLGRWTSDYDFMRETVARYDGRCEWRDEMIARCF